MPQGERLTGWLRFVECARRPLKQPPEQLRIGGIGFQPCQHLLIEHLALNLLKQDTSVKVGIAAKRKMAGWDNDYLLNVLRA